MNVFVEHDWFWSPFVKAYLRHREKEQSLVKTIKYAMKRCCIEETTVLVKPGILESLPDKP